MPHLLLLEDDPGIRLATEQHLLQEGFHVSAFATGAEGLKFLAAKALDVAVLDITLPDMDGIEVLRAIRQDSHHRNLPVLLVTAHNEDIDRVLARDLWADDYVSRPLSSRELVARIRAILRRGSFLEKTEPSRLATFENIEVDLDRQTVTVDGKPVELTRREFELLTYFVQNPRRVLSRDRLLQDVWQLRYLGESRTIDAHVRRVRTKLGSAGNLIETVVGVGYRMG